MPDYELILGFYQGPLDKLLELIEAKKLEITQISLAEVTADFLEYLKKLEAGHLDHALIADFIVVASKLVLIKSKTLLPALNLDEEEEKDIRLLEERLKIYAEMKYAKEIIRGLWRNAPQMAAREFLTTARPAFYPPQKAGQKELLAAVVKVAGELARILTPVKTLKTEIINLKKKIEEILKKLTVKPAAFGLLKTSGTKSELIVLFLAVLHLIKEELVHVEQAGHFGEITIAKRA